MRWFPDRLIVLFTEVVIDLYKVIVLCCFLRNAPTLLYVNLPLDVTLEIKNNVTKGNKMSSNLSRQKFQTF